MQESRKRSECCAGRVHRCDGTVLSRQARWSSLLLARTRYVISKLNPVVDAASPGMWTVSLVLLCKSFYETRTNPQSTAFIIPLEGSSSSYYPHTDPHDESHDPFQAKSREERGYRPSGDYYAGRVFEGEAPEGYSVHDASSFRRGDLTRGTDEEGYYRPSVENPFKDVESRAGDHFEGTQDPYERIRKVGCFLPSLYMLISPSSRWTINNSRILYFVFVSFFRRQFLSRTEFCKQIAYTFTMLLSPERSERTNKST